MNWNALLWGLLGLGGLCVAIGAFEISEPAGFIVTGVTLIVVALLPDWGA